MKVFRGRLVHSVNPEKIEIIEDAVIGYSEENGQVNLIVRYRYNNYELFNSDILF